MPRTLLIDSNQLESGDVLDKEFREAASTEIERFRREILERQVIKKKLTILMMQHCFVK